MPNQVRPSLYGQGRFKEFLRSYFSFVQKLSKP